MTVAVRVERVEGADPGVPLPAYQSAGAAGLDVAANLAPELRAAGLAIAPGERALVPTGVRIAVPPGFEVQMRPRSGLALRCGLTLLNSPGTIDCDFRGEVGILVINHGDAPVRVTHGMRIAQMVLAPVARLVWEEGALDATLRGCGGFGSTGTG